MNLLNKVLSALKRPWLIPVAMLFIAYYFLAIWYPLPSDEEMIEHFQEHREGFEALVQRYRNFEVGLDGFHSKWKSEEGTELMLKRAKVWHVGHVAPIWYPNPYSLKSANAVYAQSLDKQDSYALFYKYGSLTVNVEPRKEYRATNLFYIKIWKNFIYFPEIPRIENEKLLLPFNTKGAISGEDRVLLTLNKLPNNWKDYECVFRQIEPQWFIRMCNGH